MLLPPTYTIRFERSLMRGFFLILKTISFLSVLFFIVGGSTLRIGGYPLLPALFLIPVYYWLVFRPAWLPLWSLFGVGIFYDALMGYELGVSSVLLMLSAFLGQYIRALLSTFHFLLIWTSFSLYSLGYLILYGFFTSGGFPLFISWIYGIILYPLVAWILSHLHIKLQSYG